MRRFFTFKHVFIILLAVIFGNLLILNIFFLNNAKTENKTTEIKSSSNKIGSIIKQAPENITNDYCPTACIERINEATEAIDTSTSTSSRSDTITTSTQKEYFISLGTGSSEATEWSDITGAEVVINGNAYANIKQVTFQASLHTPTGNQIAYARLYNVTDNHPVWNSDVMIEGGTPLLLTSSPIILDEGTKTYRVQMKTQIGSTTNLSLSRIYISIY